MSKSYRCDGPGCEETTRTLRSSRWYSVTYHSPPFPRTMGPTDPIMPEQMGPDNYHFCSPECIKAFMTDSKA